MKKKPAARKSAVRNSVVKKSTSLAKAKPDGLGSLIAEVRQLIQSARRGVSSVIDTFQVMTNFEIGRRIVEHEQKGAKRAAYGAELLKELSARLTDEFGRGFSIKSLENMRKFYLLWKDRMHDILQTPSAKLLAVEKGQTPSDQSIPAAKPQTVSAVFAFEPISETPSRKSPFTLSWSHYVELLTVKDPDERSFYEIDATNEHWSLSELRRQKASCLYERLALSRDKERIRKLAKEGQVIVRPEDLLKRAARSRISGSRRAGPLLRV